MSYFVNAGNQADLEVMDDVNYLLDDANTNVIATYVEGFNDPHKYPDVAALALAKRKPIVMLKVGRSDSPTRRPRATRWIDRLGRRGRCDMQAESGREGGRLRRANRRFLGLPEMQAAPKGDRIGVVTNSGGAIGMIADRAMGTDLLFQDVTEKTKNEASKLLPWYGEFKSPFDIASAGSKATQDLELARAAVNFVIDDENIDLLLAVITPMDRRGTRNYLQAVVEASTRSEKPAILFNPMADFREGEGEMLKDGSIPVLNDAAECVKAIDALVKFGRRLGQSELPPEAPPAKAKMTADELLAFGRKTLTESESKTLLARYAIGTTKEKLVGTVEEAVKAASGIGYPLALKVESPDIPHKTEAGAVALNVRDEAGLRQAYDRIVASAARYSPNARISGVLVQEMIEPGQEVISRPLQGPPVRTGCGLRTRRHPGRNAEGRIASPGPTHEVRRRGDGQGDQGIQASYGFQGRKGIGRAGHRRCALEDVADRRRPRGGNRRNRYQSTRGAGKGKRSEGRRCARRHRVRKGPWVPLDVDAALQKGPRPLSRGV